MGSSCSSTLYGVLPGYTKRSQPIPEDPFPPIERFHHKAKLPTYKDIIGVIRMQLPRILSVFLTFLFTCFAAPLDLGYGGVYNSPEANAYWARRFGSLFGGSSSGGLRQLQERINQSAYANRRISRP